MRLRYQMPAPYYDAINHAFHFAHSAAAAPSNEMAAIVHAEFVGSDDRRGFGGGQLAGLWSPTAGMLSLARRRGWNSGGPPVNDDMAQWHEMPLHAVSIVDSNQHWTSSARIVEPTVFDYQWADLAPDPADAFQLFAFHDERPIEIRGCEQPSIPSPKLDKPPVNLIPGTTAQQIRVCGDISASTLHQAALGRPIPYQREFLVSEGVVSAETRLRPVVADPLAEAFETVRCSTETRSSTSRVTSWYRCLPTMAWAPGQPAPPFALVHRVKVTRHNGAMVIDFPTPRWISVARTSWTGYGGKAGT